MKIFIPFHLRDIGGPSTFVKNLKKGMESRGHQIVFEESEDYDVLFIIVQAPFDILMRAKKKKKAIVQRLDGVYYWSISGWKYPLLNLKARLIRHFFTDYTIYQSQYSKKCVGQFLGGKKNERFTVIYNGVDTEQFSPDGETINLRENPNQKIFFTASEFRRKDQLFPILHALSLYKNKYDSNFKFIIAGSFSRELKGFEKKLQRYSWIHFLGKISNDDLPKYERKADVFLFTHLNPPCPNNVIEAMACGLPICGIADGAMTELVQIGKNGFLLPTYENAYWQHRFYDTKKIADNIAKTFTKKENFSKKSRAIIENRYSLKTMTDHYEQILFSLLK